MMHAKIHKQSLTVLFFIISLIISMVSTADATVYDSSLSILYSGKKAVDMKISNVVLHKDVIYRLTVGGEDVNSEQILYEFEYVGDNPSHKFIDDSYYHSHTNPLQICSQNAAKCIYRLLVMQKNLANNTPQWTQIDRKEVDITSEQGLLYNDENMLQAFGRTALKWDLNSNNSDYVIGAVTAKTGILEIRDVNLLLRGALIVDQNAAIKAFASNFIRQTPGAYLQVKAGSGVDGSKNAKSQFFNVSFINPRMTIYEGQVDFNNCGFTTTNNETFSNETSSLQFGKSNTFIDCSFNKNGVRLMEFYFAKNTTLTSNKIYLAKLFDGGDSLWESNEFYSLETYVGLLKGTVFKNHNIDKKMTFSVSGALLQNNTLLNLTMLTVLDGAIIKNNLIKKSKFEISGDYNQIINNKLEENGYEVKVVGYPYSFSKGNILRNNVFINNALSLNYSKDAVVFANRFNCLVNAEDTTAIYLLDGQSNHVSYNKIESCRSGITLSSSSKNTIKANVVVNPLYQGLLLAGANSNEAESVSENQIDGNVVIGAENAIEITGHTKNNTFQFNKLENSQKYGIALNPDNNPSSTPLIYDNVLHSNVIKNNTLRAIYISEEGCSNNKFYNNAIYGNTAQLVSDSETNNTKWDINETPLKQVDANIVGGRYIGGNYWANYNCSDANADGISDAAYTVVSGTLIKDNFALCRNDQASAIAQFDAASVAFEGFEQMQSNEKGIVLTNSGNTALLISNILIEGKDFAAFKIIEDGCSSTIIPPQQTCIIKVAFAPDAIGEFVAELKLYSNTADVKNISLLGTASQQPIYAEQTIDLQPGWNFVSAAYQPDNNSLSSVLGSTIDKIRIVWAYKNNTWQRFKPQQENNNLHTFDANTGYWIYAVQPCSVTVYGAQRSSVNLSAGWNLIGYSKQSQSITTALSNIAEKWESIWTWDNGQWNVKFNNPNMSNASLGIINNIDKGKAYWIKMLEPAVWNH